MTIVIIMVSYQIDGMDTITTNTIITNLSGNLVEEIHPVSVGSNRPVNRYGEDRCQALSLV
jgi:hypothetical protein